MLRLRPSEITLTPADVDETRYRMTRRQAALASAALPSRAPGGPRRSTAHGLLVRRGAERSRDNAITHLGNIPILRPHQVVHSSSEAEYEDDDIAQPTKRSEVEPPSNEVPVTAIGEAPPAVEPEQPAVQFPFRPAMNTQLSSRADTECDSSLSSSPKHTSQSAVGRTRTNTSEDLNEAVVPSQLQSSTDGFGDVAPVTVTGSSNNLRRDSLFLQGYFASPERYTFRQHQTVPYTEPRQRPRQLALRPRAISSNSDPPQLPGRSALLPTPVEDDFWTANQRAPSEMPGGDSVLGSSEAGEDNERGRPRSSFDERIQRAHRRLEYLQGRYRGFFGRARVEPTDVETVGSELQRNSGTSSSSSLPYSYYELPISRPASSSRRSESGEQLPQSQVDGAAPSRQANRGAYHSIRSSQVRATNDSWLRAPPSRGSSYSSPDLASVGQHGLSPLPASPYTRGVSTQNSPRPSIELIGATDFPILLGEDRDAAIAARRDLPSPLELVELRAAFHLARLPSTNAIQTADADGTTRPHRRGPGSETMRRESGNTAYYCVPTSHRPLDPQMVPTYHRQIDHGLIPTPPLQAQLRDAPPGRAGQRSSENAPVGVSTVDIPPVNVGHVQAQRVSLVQQRRAHPSQGAPMRGGSVELSPISLRLGIARHPTPSYPGQRPPPQPGLRRSPIGLELSDDFYSSSPVAARQTRIQGPQRYTSGMGSVRFQHDPPTRFMPNPAAGPERRSYGRSAERPHFFHDRHLAPPAYMAPYRQQEPSIGAIPHNTRRPPIPARIASRRMSAQQLNQENSGEAEIALMRDELLEARMRFVDDEGGMDVMDETPPPVGRFERHIQR